jgi:NAD(P)-dependent dehydrogenase (short-subunit alcohol dehydrogenase family)
MDTSSARVALITGAAGDIGAAAAAAFARSGAALAITDRRADALDAVAQGLRAKGARVDTYPCDQTDPDGVATMFAAIQSGFGRLDAAFINAGYGRYGALIDMPFDQWKRHVDVNLNGGFLMAQGAARAMAAGGQGGAIVMNASTAAAYPCDLLSAYAASKAGVRMLARSLASELGVHRIRVNLVMPGVIETAMTKSLIEDEAVHADVLAQTPVGRLGAPSDIADLVVFLCSAEAGYITGAEILADGGQTIHGYPRWFSADYTGVGAPWRPHAS